MGEGARQGYEEFIRERYFSNKDNRALDRMARCEMTEVNRIDRILVRRMEGEGEEGGGEAAMRFENSPRTAAVN